MPTPKPRRGSTPRVQPKGNSLKRKTNIIHCAFLLVALICFALLPKAQAACEQGCLSNANTALGKDALINVIGSENTPNGFEALLAKTTGNSNTATGWGALTANITGNNNTANGTGALQFNITGTENTATGDDALI